jgi:hypothetical protein
MGLRERLLHNTTAIPRALVGDAALEDRETSESRISDIVVAEFMELRCALNLLE